MAFNQIVLLIPTFVIPNGWQAVVDAPQDRQPDIREPESSLPLLPKTSKAEFNFLLQNVSGGQQPIMQKLEDGLLPIDVAKALLEELLSVCGLDKPVQNAVPRSVGILEDEKIRASVFIYTIAIPGLVSISETKLDSCGFSKRTVEQLSSTTVLEDTKNQVSLLSPILAVNSQWCTLKYWANLISSTNSALELLPKYFTISQLSDIFSALLHPEKGSNPFDQSNFRRWAGVTKKDLNGPLLVELSENLVVKDEVFDTAMHLIRKGTVASTPFEMFGLKAIEDLLQKQGTPWTSPIDSRSIRRDDGSNLPPPVVKILVNIASTIAFYPSKDAGASASYYTAKKKSLVHLADRFNKSPSWLKSTNPSW